MVLEKKERMLCNECSGLSCHQKADHPCPTKISHVEVDPNNMTKDEAYLALRNGHKITHQYFDSEEYLYFDGCIKSEEGYNFTEGWRDRNDETWQTGWRIYTEKVNGGK